MTGRTRGIAMVGMLDRAPTAQGFACITTQPLKTMLRSITAGDAGSEVAIQQLLIPPMAIPATTRSSFGRARRTPSLEMLSTSSHLSDEIAIAIAL
jgi:hypothetical protein